MAAAKRIGDLGKNKSSYLESEREGRLPGRAPENVVVAALGVLRFGEILAQAQVVPVRGVLLP